MRNGGGVGCSGLFEYIACNDERNCCLTTTGCACNTILSVSADRKNVSRVFTPCTQRDRTRVSSPIAPDFSAPPQLRRFWVFDLVRTQERYYYAIAIGCLKRRAVILCVCRDNVERRVKNTVKCAPDTAHASGPAAISEMKKKNQIKKTVIIEMSYEYFKVYRYSKVRI